MRDFYEVRDEAREHARRMGITYDKITREMLDLLWAKCEIKLMEYRQTGNKHALQMKMSMAPMRKKDVKIKSDGSLAHAELQVNGSYFSRREAVTFEDSGFIGLCCELSGINATPILDAFKEWCNAVASEKEAANGRSD